MTHQSARLQRLLDHLDETPSEATSAVKVVSLYTAWGFGPQRSTARGDLKTGATRGHLIAVPGHDTTYRLNHAHG